MERKIHAYTDVVTLSRDRQHSAPEQNVGNLFEIKDDGVPNTGTYVWLAKRDFPRSLSYRLSCILLGKRPAKSFSQ